MKILVTGGTGMVGSAFKEVNTNHVITLVGSKDYDLTDVSETREMISNNNPDAIIHLAAKVGGVKGNKTYMNDFFVQNLAINMNVLQESHNMGVDKVVSLLSTCVYPDDVKFPLTEGQIHSGFPHHSNYGYAYAKRMIDIHSRTLRTQYGRKYICAVPNNLYGPHDNFDLENGHVAAAIFRKIHEAKHLGIVPRFWGDGAARREFTYSEDIAKILLFLIENYDGEEPINVGDTHEISIKELVIAISEIVEYEGKIEWDVSKPSGQFRKPSSNNKFMQLNSDFCYTSFTDGLRKTYSWLNKAYPDIRGIK